MSAPVFFVVERTPGGGEMPSLCYDILPDRLTRKVPKGSSEPAPMVYALRLDLLPDAERWRSTPLSQLHARYRELRDAGKLPPSNLHAAAAKTDPARRKIGEWWEPTPPTWNYTAPFERPAVGVAVPAAGAYIGPAHIAEALAQVDSTTGRGQYVGLRRDPTDANHPTAGTPAGAASPHRSK